MGESIRTATKKPEAIKNVNSVSKARKVDVSPSVNSPVDQIFFLQRTIGNQAVLRLFKSGVIQAKLKINQLGDMYEQEANRVADAVMRMPAPESIGQTKTSDLTQGPVIQRLCTGCEEELKKSREDKEEMLQAKEAAGHTPEVTPALQGYIDGLRGGGQPLAESERAFFEPRFGYDFSQVRIHTDDRAVESARALNAQAFTVGRDVVFGAGTGQYSPHTSGGRKLLAHELAHVIQQGAGTDIPQSKIQRAPLSYQYPLLSVFQKYPVEIRWSENFRPGANNAEYIYQMSQLGYAAPLKIKYGNMGEGFIYVYPGFNVFTLRCQSNLRFIPFPSFPPMAIPYREEECNLEFDPDLTLFDAPPQVIPFELPALDVTGKNGTLALVVKIDSNIISGKLGWLPGKTKDDIHPLNDYSAVQTNQEAFLPLIYGKDYNGNNFASQFFNNQISDGRLIFGSAGWLSIPNQQEIWGAIQLGDTNNFWLGDITTNIMGAEESKLPLERTAQGDLSGKSDGLKLESSWVTKGFSALGKIHISFFNSNFFASGEVNYKSERGYGNLLLAITDYNTAKRYAVQFLPEEIAAKAQKDEPPSDANERLAFIGAGNLNLVLFDGNKETRKMQKTDKDAVGDEPEKQPNTALEANAAFVVEPEGYITVSGQVKPKQEEFELFREHTYDKEIKWTIPIAKIPGPLATSADFNFTIKLIYGATIGPLTLSEILAEGIYSNRPDTLSELQLSGLISLNGSLFAKVEFCLELSGSIFGVFEVELLEACISAGAGFAGAIQARPNIQVVIPTEASKNTPPEYYIRGTFNFDAAGKLFLFIGDSLKINLTEEEPNDPAKPGTWKYKNSKKIKEKKFGSRDVEVPMDHTLGSREIPRVSFRQFAKENLSGILTQLITQDRPPVRKNEKEYFEPGQAVRGLALPEQTDEKFKAGGFEQAGEERGELAPGKAAEPPKDAESNFVFTEDLTMYGSKHKLHLVVKDSIKGGTRNIETTIMMESEQEELSDKISEEKKIIASSNSSAAEFQKTDLADIEKTSNQVQAHARQLGIDNKLSNEPSFPALKIAAEKIENYGDTYVKNDLGEPDKPLTPKCDKPADALPGYDIFFPNYTGGQNLGTVIEVVSYPDKTGQNAYWHIRFKPRHGRKTTTHAPRAYDNNCNPTYIIAKDQSCASINVKADPITVPARIINNVQYREPSKKAEFVLAYPLCWGIEQVPEEEVVGRDRLHKDKKSKWHRAHLVHAKMGGKGAKWNLVPVPQYINNVNIPSQYESTLINLVLNGFKNGKKYWFAAKVNYHNNSDNSVIGYYEDFAKEINIYYGEATDKGNNQWDLKDQGVLRTTIKLGNVPHWEDLAPNRRTG